MIDDRRHGLSEQAIVAIVYVAAMFVAVLDQTIVNVALPTLAKEFDVAVSASDWVITGYLLSLAVFIPSSGWIGDRLGTKRTFLIALGIFTGASMLCGFAQSLEQMVAFRVLQGVGGGMLTPVGLAMLYRAYPPERRAQASKILVIPTAIAPALGPIVGGLLIDKVSWRWVFFINLPIGLAAFAFGAIMLTERREPSAGSFDLPGFGLVAIGLVSFMFAITEGPVKGWSSPLVMGTGALGVAALVLLVRVELRATHPMLQLRLFGNRLFRATNRVAMFSTAAFLGALFIVPVMLQEARGASALESGLTTFPEAIGVLSVSQLAGRLYPRLGPRALMTSGLVAMSTVLLVMSTVGADTSEWAIRGSMFCLGASFSFMIISLQASSFATISPADTGRASALYNTQRQVSAALGVAILASCLAWFLPAGDPTQAQTFGAYHRVFLVCAGIAAIGAVAARFVDDEDAASTMVTRSRPVSVGDH